MRAVTRLALLALLGIFVGLQFVGAQGPKRDERRRTFMRQKLEYSKNVLEGLAVEDFEAIRTNAGKLKILSQAAEWEVNFIPHVEEYLPYTVDFQRICDDLAEKARRKNIDGATLAYVRLTVNCVDCHKYVRAVTR